MLLDELISLPEPGGFSLEHARVYAAVSLNGVFHAEGDPCELSGGNTSLKVVPLAELAPNFCEACAQVCESLVFVDDDQSGVGTLCLFDDIALLRSEALQLIASLSSTRLPDEASLFRACTTPLYSHLNSVYRDSDLCSIYAGSSPPKVLGESAVDAASMFYALGWEQEFHDRQLAALREMVSAHDVDMPKLKAFLASAFLANASPGEMRFNRSFPLRSCSPEVTAVHAQAQQAIISLYRDDPDLFLVDAKPSDQLRDFRAFWAFFESRRSPSGQEFLLAPSVVADFMGSLSGFTRVARLGELDEKVLETAMVLYDPSSPGPFSSLQGAVDAARHIE